MSLIVNNVGDLKTGFVNFAKGTKMGPYQLFYFPVQASDIATSKNSLMQLFTTYPAFQWIEIDGRAIIQESVSLTEAAQKIIGPNFKQKTTNQDVYQLHNAPTYGIIINNFEVAHDAPEQNPLNLDQLKEIFGNTKVVIIYIHTLIPTGQLSNYTDKVANKIVKTFDEDDSTCWSIVTNQLPLSNPAAILANGAVATTAQNAIAGGASAVISAAKGDSSNLANASTTFKAELAKLNAGSFSTAADAYNAIAALAAEYVPSASAQRIIDILTKSRDITVRLIDATDDLTALAKIQNMPKDKPFVLLLDNFDPASSLLNRELVKYRSMAIAERQNASGYGYAVCQFMIANPISTCYLTYDAK